MQQGKFRRWICDACGYIYDEAEGDPDSGLPPGTRYEDIPDDWQCPLCGLTKADLRPLPEAPVDSARPEPRRGRPGSSAAKRGGPNHVVIVGAGMAGWSVAEAIRRRDPQRPVLLVSACEGLVYPKPELSTALARGRSVQHLVRKDALSRAAELDIEVSTRTRVVKIDASKKRIITTRGGIKYDKLVLAVGARQRELEIDGDAAGEVLRVNDIGSYKILRKRLEEGVRHVTILGAGLIGCEFAEDLTSGGYRVSVVDPAGQPLSNLLPGPIAQRLQQSLADKGVDWRFRATLTGLWRTRSGLHAQLSTAEGLDTDLVLSAAGLVPNAEPAAKAGLRVGRGIVVDRHMRTSDPDIYALGDCAEVEGQIFAYIEPIRRQAEAVAAQLCGDSRPFEPLPPLIRVKTPSLPLTICLTPGASPKAPEWKLIQADGEGCRMEFGDDELTQGFALCGEQTRLGTALYQRLVG